MTSLFAAPVNEVIATNVAHAAAMTTFNAKAKATVYTLEISVAKNGKQLRELVAQAIEAAAANEQQITVTCNGAVCRDYTDILYETYTYGDTDAKYIMNQIAVNNMRWMGRRG